MKGLFALLLVALASSVRGVPLSDFAPFGDNDLTVMRGDDTTARLDLPGVFPYFGYNYSSIYVTTNGAVTLGEDMDRFTPSLVLDDLDFPLIAPYWADADTRGNDSSGAGTVYYRLTEDSMEDKQLVLRYIDRAFPQHLPFVPRYVIVVTWFEVGYFDRGDDLRNTFQLVLATDDVQSFAFFNYLDDGINWVLGDVNAGLDGLNSEQLSMDYPQAGFSAGNTMDSLDLLFSRMPLIAMAYEFSNLGGPDGFFGFQIEGNPIISARDIECGEPPLSDLTGGLMFTLLNGTVNFQSMAMYSCAEEGFVIVGAVYVTCLENLTWSSGSPFCQLADCLDPPLPDPEDTEVMPMITLTPPAQTTFGAVAIYSCGMGYQIVGNGTRVCQIDSQWSGTTPICEIAECEKEDLFPEDRSGLIINAPLTTVNSTARHFCLREYMLIGDENRTCLPNRSWTGEPTRCQLIDCSITDPQMSDGILNFMFSPNAELDGMIIYTCIDGYTLIGSATRTCQSDGMWNGTAPTCDPVDCGPPPSDDMTNVRVSFTLTTFMSLAFYSCNETGLEVVGNDTIVCEASGNWSRGDEVPMCQLVDCGPPEMSNFTEVEPVGGPTTFGSSFTYSCIQGYNLVSGDVVRTCTETGMYNGTLIECEVVVCPDLMIVPPLTAFTDVTGITFGQSVHVECEVGFMLNGPMYLLCTEFGNFSSPLPTCEEIDCGEPMDEGVDPQRMVMPMNMTAFNVTRVYSCVEGYTLNGSMTRTCSADGMWSGIPPFCNLVDCGQPMDEVPDPQRMVMPSDVTTFNTVRSYSCATGYNLVGSDMRTCQQDSTWSGTPPVCEVVTCPDPMIASPLLSLNDTSDVTFGQTIHFDCEVGYFLQGQSYITCTEFGNYSAALPTCEIVDCMMLTVMNPGSGNLVLDQSDGTLYTNVTTYSCDMGYEVIGDAIRTCQADGQWSGTEPMCQLVTCPMLSAELPLIVMNPDDLEFNQMATYRCDGEGLVVTPVEYQTRTCQADGTWSGMDPACEFVDCGQPMDEDGTDPYLEVEYTALTFPNNRSYSCNNTNFTIIDGSPIRTCQADGTWSGTAPTCTFVNCGNPSISTEGETEQQIVTTTGLLEGDTTTYDCQIGFTIGGGDRVRTCELNPLSGQYEWSGEPGYCEVVRCGRDVLVVGETFFNGRRIEINTTFTNDVYLSIVTYQCENGFTVIGDSVRVCQANATWSGEAPTMCQIVDCGPPPVPTGEEFNNITVSYDNTTFSSVATYSCPEGFSPDVDEDIGLDDTRTCQGNGNWSTPTPTCVAELSAGAIAGIVIGSFIGLLLLALLIIIIVLVIALIIKKASSANSKPPIKPIIVNEGHESVPFDPVDPDQGEKQFHLHFVDDAV